MDTNLTAIISAIESARANGYRYFGVRSDDSGLVIGSHCNRSFDWDFENDCPSETQLSGTCATMIDMFQADTAEEMADVINAAIGFNKVYGGSQYIVAGTDAESGFDDNELVISDTDGLFARIGALIIAAI